MPNYLYITVLVPLFVIIFSLNDFAQEQKRNFSTDTRILNKIAENRTLELSKNVILTEIQRRKIIRFYFIEAQSIDSLKYLPSEFYEHPNQAREAIISIKRNTENKVYNLLSDKQRELLESNREQKRMAAIKKLQQEAERKKAVRQ